MGPSKFSNFKVFLHETKRYWEAHRHNEIIRVVPVADASSAEKQTMECMNSWLTGILPRTISDPAMTSSLPRPLPAQLLSCFYVLWSCRSGCNQDHLPRVVGIIWEEPKQVLAEPLEAPRGPFRCFDFRFSGWLSACQTQCNQTVTWPLTFPQQTMPLWCQRHGCGDKSERETLVAL